MRSFTTSEMLWMNPARRTPKMPARLGPARSWMKAEPLRSNQIRSGRSVKANPKMKTALRTMMTMSRSPGMGTFLGSDGLSGARAGQSQLEEIHSAQRHHAIHDRLAHVRNRRMRENARERGDQCIDDLPLALRPGFDGGTKLLRVALEVDHDAVFLGEGAAREHEVRRFGERGPAA